MKTIKLSKKEYNGSWCIFIRCEPDPRFDRMIRSYPGRVWSKSNRSWYIKYGEDSYDDLTRYFRGNFKIVKSDDIVPDTTPWHGPQTIIKKDTGYGPVEMRFLQHEGKIIIKFLGRYDKSWIDELRQYGAAFYDKVTREWSLKASRIAIDSLSDYFNERGIELRVRKDKPKKEIAINRKRTGSEVRSRALKRESLEAITRVERYLREKRFSERTINAYASQIEFFFKYFYKKKPEEIDSDDISEFMDEYVIKLGYSTSFQNQMISVLKAYSTVSGNIVINPEDLSRPKRSRPLPQVFSKDEVTRILNSPRNIKHKLILWIIYSCGLRRSEVINIRLNDINIERGMLHIRSGKGDSDRVVPLSGILKIKLEEYLTAYSPNTYLFEGQKGGRYTASSVHGIFKTALSRTGINKEVGVHSLRHSYATHLHENGLDIRYIQELLGHKSSKTTEIYTHVSRRKLLEIRSPIEDLDLF